jgi:hypothetical protein
MKRTLIILNIVFAALVLAIQLGNQKAQNFNSSAAVAAPAPAAMAVPMPARCPSIHAAIEGLRSSEQELRDAGHDFCGHKVEAMRRVHAAIEELRMAEGCDRCR